MTKPIVAMSLKGVLFTTEPWDEAHKLWFEHKAEELQDPAIAALAFEDDWWPYVDHIMERQYPELVPEERVVRAREQYFESVAHYIEQHPDTLNIDVVELLEKRKNRFSYAILTTNTPDVVKLILENAGINDLFDIIEGSLPIEKDDKEAVFERFFDSHGKPSLYLSGERKENLALCQEHDVPIVLVTTNMRALDQALQ